MTVSKEESPDTISNAEAFEEKPQDQTQLRRAATETIIPMYDDPVHYDALKLTKFIKTVFHTNPDSLIFAHCAPTAPRGMGKTFAEVLETLTRTTKPMPCYYGTSTLGLTEGELRHTKQAFKQLHVIVLDDIGTKIPESKIPDTMEETYRIETSAGNFQLGYVLREPMSNYEEAQALLHLIAGAGVTDKGGCMPCKKVRLPCGINGKKGPKGSFSVMLHWMDGPLWSPQEIIDALELDVDWEVYRKSLNSPQARTRRIGAVAWSPIHIEDYDFETGRFDPVVEWLYQENMVKDDGGSGAWMTIKCPWSDTHTDGETTAGYVPLGRGKKPAYRGFHCFHEHCNGRKIIDFLEEVQVLGGPEAAVYDATPTLNSQYVFDIANHRLWDIQSPTPPVPLMVETLKAVTQKVLVPRVGKTPLAVSPIDIMLRQPTCVKIHGPTFDASQPTRLVRSKTGELRLNLYRPQEHAPVKLDMAHVDPFLDFIEYLIPDAEERAYFMKWLACKAQRPEFRGCGMIMVAKSEGTGRGTLVRILSKLFGSHNMRGISLSDLLSSNWTDWQQSLFVHIDETLAVDEYKTARTAYNKLKEMVDPMVKEVTVNPKGQSQYSIKTCASFLFFSNHDDAVYMARDSRRFFAIRNAYVPRDGEYFEKLHKWIGTIESDEVWIDHLWQYLQTVAVDMAEMHERPPVTDTQDEINHATKSQLDALVEVMVDIWPADLLPIPILMDALSGWAGLPDGYKTIAKRQLRERLYSLDKLHKAGRFDNRFRVDGVLYGIHAKTAAYIDSATACELAKEKAVRAIVEYDAADFRLRVNEAMTERGFEF